MAFNQAVKLHSLKLRAPDDGEWVGRKRRRRRRRKRKKEKRRKEKKEQKKRTKGKENKKQRKAIQTRAKNGNNWGKEAGRKNNSGTFFKQWDRVDSMQRLNKPIWKSKRKTKCIR